MKSVSDLTDFYYNELYADLEELEIERKEVLKKLTLYISLITLVSISIILFIVNSYGINDSIFFIGFVAFVLAGFLYKFTIKTYASNFKIKIITPLIHAIDENLRYTPSSSISQSQFERSKLFDKTPNRFSGNDLVKGEIDFTPLEFSDVLAQYVTRDSKGRTSTHTIFEGLFVVAEFNKKLQSTTIVLPDKAEKMFGSMIGSWLQSNNFSKSDLVKLDNHEFEKEFVVYGENQIEARYILTHSLMERILEYKKRTQKEISLSFIGEKLYMAIHYNKDLFEPTVFKSLLDIKITMEYIKTLQLSISIVQELKLNEKLWSKV